MGNKTITEINHKEKIKISTQKQSDRNETKSIHRVEGNKKIMKYNKI